MFTIVKESAVASECTPAYMESPIWNVFIFRGFTIESKPSVPFCITPNGDMSRFDTISSERF